MFTKRLTFIILSSLIICNVWGKVIPPNYNFSLDKFTMFLPGSPLAPIQEKYGVGELMSRRGTTNVFRYYIKENNYKFPIMVQVFNNQVLDFVANVPSYFLHDIYHQSLINRYGKQDRYLRVGEQAVYVWNNKKNARHVYVGACAITCYPVYYAVRMNQAPEAVPGYTSILERMVEYEQNTADELKVEKTEQLVK